MATQKEVLDAYENNENLRSIIDAYLKGFPEQYEEVLMNIDGQQRCFKRVVELTNISDYTFRIVHSDMIFGHITDYQTEATGVVRLKSVKIGEREYKGK